MCEIVWFFVYFLLFYFFYLKKEKKIQFAFKSVDILTSVVPNTYSVRLAYRVSQGSTEARCMLFSGVDWPRVHRRVLVST